MNVKEFDNATLVRAHALSLNNRAQIEASEQCACFYCKQVFSAREVATFAQEALQDGGATALCPRCGMDSVIGDASGLSVSSAFVEAMHVRWF